MAIHFTNNEDAKTIARDLQQTAQDLYDLYERLDTVTKKIDSSWGSSGEDKASYIDGLNKSISSVYQLVTIMKDTGITSENFATSVFDYGQNT